MANVASRIRNIAPDLWCLFDILLRADLQLKHRKLLREKKEVQSTHSASLASHGQHTGTVSQPAPDHGDIEMGDVSLNDWGSNQDFYTDLMEDEEDEPENLHEQENMRQDALIIIVHGLILEY